MYSIWGGLVSLTFFFFNILFKHALQQRQGKMLNGIKLGAKHIDSNYLDHNNNIKNKALTTELANQPLDTVDFNRLIGI